MPSFKNREKKRLVGIRDDLFGDPGQGLYGKHRYPFVLARAERNLWPGIRQDAVDYFTRNGIAWHRTKAGELPGHVLSSQVACVNHLFLLRQRPDLATAVLAAIDPDIVAAEEVDDGFVAFEFIGEAQRLREKAFSRGTNCTSVDAAMIGRTGTGDRRLFLIEWKYVESYSAKDLYIDARAKVYDHLIVGPGSPFNPGEPRAFYFDPFYQLMRQTLLGALITQHRDYGCNSYRHIHISPVENGELHFGLTAPNIRGSSVSEAWRRTLKEPERFVSTNPRAFMKPVKAGKDSKALCDYLDRRYWSGV